MKKFSPWMIFWSIVLLISLFYTVKMGMDIGKLNDQLKALGLTDAMVKEWILANDVQVAYTMGNVLVVAEIVITILIAIILFILYKQAPN